jgi:hypothetical protein
MKTILTTTLLVMALHMAAPPSISSAQYADHHHHGPRFRFGAEGGAGFWPKEDLGLGVAVYPNLGIQFNDFVGLVGVTGLTMGGFTDRASPDLDDKFGYFNGMGLLDLTFMNGLQVGGGGGVDYGDFGVCEDGDQICRIRRTTRGAVHGRLAIVPGFRTARGRMGFPIAVHYHAPFFDGKPEHQLMFTFGFQRY